MFQKPLGFNRVGVIQFFLAAFFVLWFLILPATGIYFAWPVKPPLTALFLGAGFILRSYFGFHLWHEKDWYKLRWSMNGDFVFLGVLFIATWWHIDEMNWHLIGVSQNLRLFSFLIALLPALKNTLLAFFYIGTGIAALLFFNPEFANMRWPWELNPFDARIMAAWPAACAVWSLTMYEMKDWAEVKIGVRAILLFVLSLFIIWVITFHSYDPVRKNGLTFGVGTGLLSAALIYTYWKQQTSRPRKNI